MVARTGIEPATLALSRNSISSRYASNSFFFSQTRHCTTFTLQDFYIESVTAHRTKINDHSCFHNSWPNSKSKTSLRARGPPGVSGALCSLRILRIGRIGSAYSIHWTFQLTLSVRAHPCCLVTNALAAGSPNLRGNNNILISDWLVGGI